MRRVFRHQKSSSTMVWATISKTWKSPLIFVPQGAKVNTNSYIETILTPALKEPRPKNTSKTNCSLSNKQCTVTHVQKNSEVVPGSLCMFLEQGGLATLITKPEPNGLLCLVPFGGRCLCFS